MTGVLEWLLDLRDIRLGRDAPLLLEWNPRIEAWMLAAITVVTVTWVVVYYRRERTTVGRRVVLGLLRCALIGLVIVTICQPSLVLQRNRIEPSHVAVLVDTSMSMATIDNANDADPALATSHGAASDQQNDVPRASRLDIARRLLTHDQGAPLQRLLAHNGIHLRTFDSAVSSHGFAWNAEELGPLIAALDDVTARGDATDLPGAIRDTIEHAYGHRLAAIVLVSDGRNTVSTSLGDALDLATDRRIPIYPLRIGSPDPRFDLEVGPLRAQETVFANDIIAVEVQVTARGIVKPVPVTMRLVDEHTSSVVATADVVVPVGDKPMTVELRTKADRVGRISYRAEVPPLEGELTPRNNADRVLVTVLNEQVKVLYVEGYPRYEYRYLKNALVREPTIDASVLLLEADEQFVQEGTDPIRRFPETREELDRYDVVLFGDVDPRGPWLSPAQADALLEFVERRGGGFGLIAGERAAPRYFADTPLEPLIPIRIDPTFLGRYETSLTTGFVAKLTDAGRRSRLFRFSADRGASERMFNRLPALYWFARTLGPRPGATVLAEHPNARSAFGVMPLLVTGRYGAGKILFQATDDTWRWRRRTGEMLHDAYWVQVVRALTPSGRAARDRRYVIRTDRKAYPYGTAARVQVEMYDTELLAQQRTELEAVLFATDVAGAESRAPGLADEAGASLRQRDLVARFTLHGISAQPNIFEASYIPPRPGRFLVQVSDIPARPGETTPSAALRVERPDLELRRPEADHDALERIAAVTGGRVVEPDGIENAFASIRDRSARIPDDIREPLWDSKLIFGLFALMISLEWVLRKAFGLM